MSVVDLDRHIVVATLSVGLAPSALALADTDDRLYVADLNSSDLVVLSVRSLQTLGQVKVGAAPTGVAIGRRRTRLCL
ncbi:MAG: YncE family protein [Methyloceanibacter sp.]|uniref:YncE family protein n=1 Tax=Methyloceanibacter sp. TaxID=1965321 RepID=UPI003D9AB7DA